MDITSIGAALAVLDNAAQAANQAAQAADAAAQAASAAAGTAQTAAAAANAAAQNYTDLLQAFRMHVMITQAEVRDLQKKGTTMQNQLDALT